MTSIANDKPFADSRIARFLDKRIEELSGKKSQREIAKEVGFSTPNIISMMKKGDARVPLERVFPLAKALEVDPKHLMRLALEQTFGQGVIADLFDMVLSENEMKIIKAIREINPEDPGLNDQRVAALNREFGPSATAVKAKEPPAA